MSSVAENAMYVQQLSYELRLQSANDGIYRLCKARHLYLYENKRFESAQPLFVLFHN